MTESPGWLMLLGAAPIVVGLLSDDQPAGRSNPELTVHARGLRA